MGKEEPPVNFDLEHRGEWPRTWPSQQPEEALPDESQSSHPVYPPEVPEADKRVEDSLADPSEETV